jgi:hypothetical protein
MSVEADPVRRTVAAASFAAIYGTLPRRTQPSGQRPSDLVSFGAGGKKEPLGAVRCRERLVGLLKYYEREAA